MKGVSLENFKKLYLLNNKYNGRDDFFFYKEQIISPATDKAVFTFETDNSRYGSITSFQIGFRGNVPPNTDIDTNYLLSWNNKPIPYTGSGEKLQISLFLNKDIPYFIPFNGEGNEKLVLSFNNTDPVLFYTMFIKINGFYIRDNLKLDGFE